MSAKTSQGYLLISDITGYTSYVAQTELEHSQEVLTELLELLVRMMTPIATLSKLEGDAVFVYAPADQVDRGELIFEMIEACYYAFRDRVTSIDRGTTCTCNACRAIPTLDLKFLVHFGEYIIQSISSINELVGSDVNLVHRLTKNRLREETGWTAYAMFTENCLQQMELPSEGMHPLVETYDHLGDVSTFSIDLRERYAQMIENRKAYITEKEADVTLEYELDIPVPVAWEWVTNVQKRTLASDGPTWSTFSRTGGRTGVGTTNHCAHGKGEISVETILDWRPFKYFTVDNQAKIEENSAMDMINMHEFKSIADGEKTHLIIRTKFHKTNFLMKLIAPMMARSMLTKYYRNIESMAKAEMNKSQLKPNYQLLMEQAAAQNSGEK
jgi:hypothetical protein